LCVGGELEGISDRSLAALSERGAKKKNGVNREGWRRNKKRRGEKNKKDLRRKNIG